jgi:hypothetical protein
VLRARVVDGDKAVDATFSVAKVLPFDGVEGILAAVFSAGTGTGKGAIFAGLGATAALAGVGAAGVVTGAGAVAGGGVCTARVLKGALGWLVGITCHTASCPASNSIWASNTAALSASNVRRGKGECGVLTMACNIPCGLACRKDRGLQA